MKLKQAIVLTLTAGALAVAASFGATAPPKAAPRHDVPAALAKEAKISLAQARATALAKVPKGEVASEELEREHGKLIYSFDIRVPGKPGVEEVNVSALDGKVIAMEHESARTEKREEQSKPKPPSTPRH